MTAAPSNLTPETVLEVHHWNDSLFSFKTTRNGGLRFKNGHFLMIGLEVEGKPLLRAYSVASPNYEEHLEFYSIKVPDGPLTSRLQHLKPGDPGFTTDNWIQTVPVAYNAKTTLFQDLKPGSNSFDFALTKQP